MPSPRSRASTSYLSARPIFRSSWGCHSTTPATPISERSIKSRQPPQSAASPLGCISSRPRWTELLRPKGVQVLHHAVGSLGEGRDPERPVRDQALTTVDARIDRELDTAKRLPLVHQAEAIMEQDPPLLP